MPSWKMLGAFAIAAMASFGAAAQSTARVTGDLTGTAPGVFTLTLTFECTGAPTCTGTYRAVWQVSGCSNSIVVTDKIVITGVGFTPGPLSGRATLTNLEIDGGITPPGICTVTENFDFDDTYTGTSDGTTGTFTVMPADFPGATFTGHFTLSRVAPPVFQMSVSGQVDGARGNVAANLTFRPQDVGTTGSVYVFALAPTTLVANASTEKGAHLGYMTRAGEKAAVPCVLAQLNASGQLRAVSTSSLQAYVTGVLSGQGQAVTVLNGVPTVNIAGATFYLGYGTNSQSMINGGVNRSVVSAPGTQRCEPAPPQTGWWWNASEAGRGYSIEVAGNHLFLAAYLYDVSGRASWLITSGNTSLDGTLFNGSLESYSGGQSLSGSYRGPSGVVGQPITLAFSDSQHGTMSWPGGTYAIERFNIVPNGLSQAPRAGQPEAGWWWNPNESGRGFFLEWQGGQLFMAGYMYDDAGNPIWYLSGNSTASTNLQSYSNQWLQFGNGQTLTGTYRPPTQVNGNVAPVTIQFSGAETGIMTLPGGRTTAIQRFRF